MPSAENGSSRMTDERPELPAHTDSSNISARVHKTGGVMAPVARSTPSESDQTIGKADRNRRAC